MLLPTPFLLKPMIKHGADYFPLSPNLLFRFLEHFIYRTLKREDKVEFSTGFGPVFEAYVKQCLEAANVSFMPESALNRLLGGTGKCVDFTITEGDSNVLIDAKGVEASRVARVAHTADALFTSLKQSAVKAVLQGMETAQRIATAKEKLPQLGSQQHLFTRRISS